MYIYRGRCSVFHRWWSQSGLRWHMWQDRRLPSSATSRCHTRCQLFRIADLWTDQCRKNISFCPPTMSGTWYSSCHQLSSSYPQTHRGSWARSRSQIHPRHRDEAYLPQQLIESLLGCAEAKRAQRQVKHAMLTFRADAGGDEILVRQSRVRVGAAGRKGWPLLHINKVSRTGGLLWKHPQQRSAVIKRNLGGSTSTRSTHYRMLQPSRCSRCSCCFHTAAPLLWRRRMRCRSLLHSCEGSPHRAWYNDGFWLADSPECKKRRICISSRGHVNRRSWYIWIYICMVKDIVHSDI